MKLLVVGGGGREHALAWKLAQSPLAEKVYVAPGNAGTALEHGVENISITAIPELVAFAREADIALTVVGPEACLADGMVDAFKAAGQAIVGPVAATARLESSKSFAKSFMLRHGIPTALGESFNDATAAHRYLDQHALPVVIKADGLAAGKGVVVAQTRQEAHEAVEAMLVENRLGEAGANILIEAYLEGIEASFIVLSDGRNSLPLATSQDHKRLLDHDLGPNTGGMGAFSPTSAISPTLHARIMREIITPVIEGMAREITPYIGFLYAGLMISSQGDIKVLEFNCRPGDPEIQAILLRLKTDLVPLLNHTVNGTLDQAEIEWDRRVALCLIMAAHGYPNMPRKNDVIHGLNALQLEQIRSDTFHIFHAGTRFAAQDNPEIVTAGGRVLGVTALGENIRLAQQLAYETAAKIHFDGAQLRHDIGGESKRASRESS
ncbi:MAG: phosphoribosylamine--glycine ligase [Nitrosomonas sp.]|nr:phosphoribosylamine--glycine ligase [Nitrosomonas sp.]